MNHYLEKRDKGKNRGIETPKDQYPEAETFTDIDTHQWKNPYLEDRKMFTISY